MVRKTALVTAMLGAFASQAFALGLGDIELKSALNQPLDAEIKVLGANSRELQDLNVVLASPDAYSRTGLERIYFHTKLKFDVVTRKDGTAVVRITTREPVREPFLDFMIEASWASGQVIREYTVLVDPPVLMPAPTPATQAPTAQPAPARTEAAPAPTRRSAASAPARTPVTGTGEFATQRNDTLWKVAERVRPDEGVTMQQTMLGLQNANPDAFIGNNINNLKAGYVMRVPSREEMTAMSPEAARAEVNRQTRLWREGRSTTPAASTARTGEVTRTPAQETPAGAPARSAEPQLKLVAPDETPSGATQAGTGENGEGLDGVRAELNVAMEAVEAQRQQNAELNDRLVQLEEQIAQLHRMIQLKDNELARLQGSQVEQDSPMPGDESAAAMDETAPADGAAPADSMMAEAPEAEVSPAPASLPEEVITEDTMDGEPSAMDDLLGNPVVLGGAAGAVFLLGLLGWLVSRNRRMASTEFQESILSERRDSQANSPAGAATAAAAATAATAAAASQADSAPAESAEPEAAPAASSGPQSDSSLFTDFAVSDMGSIQDESEADPVAEADVYLAYGRFQQAEELIKNALDRAPERGDLRLKLLEIYHAARNSAGFETEAQVYAAEVGTDDASWARVSDMGRELLPGNPLFSDGDAPSASPQGDEPALADEPLLGDEPFAAEATAKDEDDDNLLDFDLEGFGTETAEESAPAEPEADLEQGLDFDLTEPAMEPVSEDQPALDVDEDEGALSAMDEVATKLDLARAYLEMGDPDGARSILDEVLEEGNDAQKAEAQELIGQL